MIEESIHESAGTPGTSSEVHNKVSQAIPSPMNTQKLSKTAREKSPHTNLVSLQQSHMNCSDPQESPSAVKKYNHQLRSYKEDHTEDEGDMKKSDRGSSGIRSLKSPSQKGQCKLTSNIFNFAFGDVHSIDQNLNHYRQKPEIRVRSSQNRRLQKTPAEPLIEREQKLEKQINQIKKDLQSLRTRKLIQKSNQKANNTIDVIQAETIYEYCQRIKNSGDWAEASAVIDTIKSKQTWKLQQTQDIAILAKPSSHSKHEKIVNPKSTPRELTFAGSDYYPDRNFSQTTVVKSDRKRSESPLGKVIDQTLEKIQMLEPIQSKKLGDTIEISLTNMSMPRLPPMPDKESKPKELIQLGRKLFSLFGVSTEEQKSQLIVSKYNNCLSFASDKLTILWYDTGRFYIGSYKLVKNQGQKFGKGVEHMPNKYLYDGEFKNNKKWGYGKIEYANGDTYEGQFHNGLKHGKGRLSQKNGTIYNGEWKNERMDGFGILQLPSGDHYEGYLQYGAQHGYGIIKFSNGDQYKGEFTQGRFQGKGIYTWSNGQIYQGEFANGCKHGKGIWKTGKNQTQDVYFGEYKNDKKCGYGKYTWKDGTVYQGEFENDQRHGVGILTEQEKVSRGVWENGKQTRSLDPEENSPDLKAYYENAKIQKKLGQHPKKRASNKSRKSMEARKHLTSLQSKTVSSAARSKATLPDAPYKPMQFYRRLGITG